MGSIQMKVDHATKQIPIVLAWVPYLLLALILVLSRTMPDFKAWLLSVSVGVKDILGEAGVKADWGAVLIIGAITLTLAFGVKLSSRVSAINTDTNACSRSARQAA